MRAARKPSRKHSDVHPGVSIAPLGDGKYRLRWRERDGAGVEHPQSWTVYCDAPGAEEWAIDVYRALMGTGHFERPEDNGQRVKPSRPDIADLRAMLVTWAAWRQDVQRAQPGTMDIIEGSIRAFVGHAQAILGLPVSDETPVPIDQLTPALCEKVITRMRVTPTVRGKGKVGRPPGEHRISQIMGNIYRAWEWATDELDRWPGLRPAPRLAAKVVPPTPPRREARPAPTWAELDAVIAEARTYRARSDAQHPRRAGDLLEICRGTGLRIGQAERLEVRDFRGLDTPVPILVVRPELGKSLQERGGRTIPLAPVLVPLIRQLANGKGPHDRICPRPKGSSRRQAAVKPITMVPILERVTEAGLMRREVWDGGHDKENGRDSRRITHFCRAGFQRGLRRAGVDERVIDRLVGHMPKTTRDQHYDGAEDPELIDAVRQVPPIAPVATEGNVREFRRG